MKIGIQLYTLREFCRDLYSFSETLKKVADIGYENVQVSGTCDFEAEWLAGELKKNGLKCVLTHTSPDKLINSTDKVAKDHSVFACENVGLGWYGFNVEDESFENFFKTYLPVADRLYENGKYFMYHNHAQEFQKKDGNLIIEHIAERFSPIKMGFTLDTYWIQVGGGDPAYWIERFAGRVPCIHLKDYAYGQKMSVIGEGNINFDRVFEKAESSGTQYMLVEQDECYGEDPFDCVKRSYDYLKARGF